MELYITPNLLGFLFTSVKPHLMFRHLQGFTPFISGSGAHRKYFSAWWNMLVLFLLLPPASLTSSVYTLPKTKQLAHENPHLSWYYQNGGCSMALLVYKECISFFSQEWVLVGGFNPSEKYGNHPQIRVKIKNVWNHHLDE